MEILMERRKHQLGVASNGRVWFFGVPMPRYRSNVAMILHDRRGRILIGERLDTPDCWQFPQGGVKKGESVKAALRREMVEELGLPPDHYRIEKSRDGYRYDFMEGKKKEGFDGQEQTYFLASFYGVPEKWSGEVNSPEFSHLRWICPRDYDLEWVPEFKREVYHRVFFDFFGLDLALPEEA